MEERKDREKGRGKGVRPKLFPKERGDEGAGPTR